MSVQETSPLVSMNAHAFNERMKKTAVPAKPESWVQAIFAEGEINFLLMFAGGHTLEIITKDPTNDKAQRFVMPLEKESDNPLERPQAQFYDDAEEITIIPDPSRTLLLRKMREFLHREYEEGRTMISVSISQSLGESE